jgi:tRNA pseudouridine38-40 synthase
VAARGRDGRGKVTLFDPEPPTIADDSVVRVRLTVAYNGRGFHGFAANPGVRTAGGTLSKAIERVLRHPAELVCAGRTDTGVHARGQVVTFDAPSDALDLEALTRALNGLCGPDIAIVDAALAEPGFDARQSAVARLYRYSVLNRPAPDPFLAATSWHVEAPLDVASLRLGCDPLMGEHDFAAFCRRPKVDAGAAPVSLVRRVLDARWEEEGDGLLHFWIEANAFCHQMVRSIAGTLVEVGNGRKRAGDVAGILASRDRHRAGNLAPPHGLCLWSVRYD